MMDALSELLLDPKRLAALGPTEEELLADLTWPASQAWRDRGLQEPPR
jgi:hypothetical protein